MWPKPSASPALKDLYKAVGLIDKNQDGVIEKSSWKNLWQAKEDYLPEADIDKNGKIGEAEAKYYLHNQKDINDETKQRFRLTQENKSVVIKLLKPKLDFARRMDCLSDTASSICNIALAMAKAGFNKNETNRLFSEALSIVNDTYFSDRDKEIQKIVFLMAEAGLFEEALRSTNNIGYYRTNCLVKIANEMSKDSLSNAGLFKKVLNTAYAIKDPGDKSSHLCDIASAMLEVGVERKQAKKVFREALCATCTIESGLNTISDQVFAISEIATAMEKAGFDKVEIFRETIGIVHKAPDVLDSIKSTVLVMCETRLNKAQLNILFKEALAVVRPIKESYLGDKQTCICFICKRMAWAGLFQEALRVVNTLDYSYEKDDTLFDIANYMAEDGLFKEALNVAQRIKESEYNNLRPLAFSRIASKMAKAGLSKEAFEVAKIISHDDPNNKIRALCDVALSMAKAGIDKKKINKVFEEALQVADIANNKYLYHTEPEMFWDIADNMAKAGLDRSKIKAVRKLGDEADKLDKTDESEKRLRRIKVPALDKEDDRAIKRQQKEN